jgi:hypothetical protein
MSKPKYPQGLENTMDERDKPQEEQKGQNPGDFVPFDTPHARLSHPNLPGYHCHWFSDTPGRIPRAQRAGYQFVTKEEVPFFGDRPNDPSVREDLGNQVRTVVDKYDNGEGIWGVLMKIPLDVYNHQQQGRQARELEKLVATTRKGQEKDVPGKDELYPTGTGIKVGPRLE